MLSFCSIREVESGSAEFLLLRTFISSSVKNYVTASPRPTDLLIYETITMVEDTSSNSLVRPGSLHGPSHALELSMACTKHPSEGTSRTRLDMGLAVGRGLPSCTSMREGFFLQYIARCGLGKVLSPLSSISSGLAAAQRFSCLF